MTQTAAACALRWHFIRHLSFDCLILWCIGLKLFDANIPTYRPGVRKNPVWIVTMLIYLLIKEPFSVIFWLSTSYSLQEALQVSKINGKPPIIVVARSKA
jgi:hypothetical protein